MTMHLIRGISTLNTRKPVVKMTKAKFADLQERHVKHNKFLKSIGMRPVSFDEFVDYVHGRGPKVTKSASVKLPTDNNVPYRRDTQKIPSLMTFGDPTSCAKKESVKYTGTLIKGIATMHKSNAVPVINEEQMQDISRMRRG
jgi:hypothetical protein